MSNIYSFFNEKVGSFTDIQKLAIKEIEEDNNCLIIAPTGSGKTEAAILPVLKKLNDEKSNLKEGVFVIYVTPLKSLNRDLLKRISYIFESFGFTVGVRHGDTSKSERLQQVKKPPNLIITTPETLHIMLLSPRLKEAFKSLKYVIVDEIHELYYNKRGAQLSVVLERYVELSGPFKRIGISATIGNYEEVGRFLFNKDRYEIVESKIEKSISVNIVMPLIPARKHDDFKMSFDLEESALARIEYIEDVIKSNNATLIFGNTRQIVETVGSRLIYLGRLENFDLVGVHHSSLDKDERIDIENKFKEGKIKSIIATSSLELGIDIGRIEVVIQYGSPRQATRLLQRVGRSGHKIGLKSNGIIITSGPLEALESASTTIKSLNNDIEKNEIENCPLDVLANQVSAIALEYKTIEIKKVFSIVKRASVFSSIEFSTFKNLISFISEIKTISLDGEYIKTGAISRKYFINNISVIPDRPRFLVKQISTNKIISTLDESFVYNNIEEGFSFITKGIPWKVIKIEENTIFVERSNELEASIPDWIGEDLPVSYSIAKTTIELFNGINSVKQFFDEKCIKNVEDFIKKQNMFFKPDFDKIMVEESEDFTILYLYLGTLANNFFARAISYLIKKSGIDAAVKATPYAIIIDYRFSPKRPNVEELIKKLFKIKIDDEILVESELFKYKFAQAAKLFGVIEKNATLTKNIMNKIVQFYKNTPIYDETVRDIKKNYIDYKTVELFINKHNSKNDIVFVKNDSPFSKEILLFGLGYNELTTLINPGDEEIIGFEKRIAGKDFSFICTYCDMFFTKNIGNDIPEEKILCIRCKSPMICISRDKYNGIISKKLSGKKLTKEEVNNYNDAIKEAGLISAYSWRAVVALTTYGIGIATAGRILKMLRTTNGKFISDILSAQRIFVKNSRFWKK
ncbi:MAG: DEAD/DEAH box helicase [Candidatus Micrarchaeia archaeon]